jgi:hypothetical protein
MVNLTAGGLGHGIGKPLGTLGVEVAGRVIQVKIPLGLGQCPYRPGSEKPIRPVKID